MVIHDPIFQNLEGIPKMFPCDKVVAWHSGWLMALSVRAAREVQAAIQDLQCCRPPSWRSAELRMLIRSGGVGSEGAFGLPMTAANAAVRRQDADLEGLAT